MQRTFLALAALLAGTTNAIDLSADGIEINIDTNCDDDVTHNSSQDMTLMAGGGGDTQAQKVCKWWKATWLEEICDASGNTNSFASSAMVNLQDDENFDEIKVEWAKAAVGDGMRYDSIAFV